MMPGDQLVSAWIPFLSELLIKSTLVLAGGLVIVGICHRRSASFRHFVLASFLVGLLFIPVLSLAPLGWETDWLPGRPQESVSVRFSWASNDGAWNPVTSARLSPAAQADTMPRSDPAPPGDLSSRTRATSASPALAFLLGHRNMTIGLMMIWCLGSLTLVFRLLLGLRGAARLTREGHPVVDPVWRVLMTRFLMRVGLARTVRLKSHKDVSVPLTWGLFKPVILIPSDHETWPGDRKSSVLYHELSHVKRLDFLVVLLVRVSLAFFWFNPLSWIVFKKMKGEQEKACDEMVIRAGIKPSTYAANLLFFRQSLRMGWVAPPSILGFFSRSFLGDRLNAILKQKMILKEVNVKTKIVLCTVIILTVAFIGTARPAGKAGSIPAGNDLLMDAAAWAAGPETAAIGQEKEQEEAQQKDKTGDKKLDKHTIIITNKDGKKIPIEITIIEGAGEKTIQVDKSITLKKGESGEVLLLDAEGEELALVEGKPVRLVIKEGDIELIEEDNVLKLAKGGVVTWRQKGADDEKDMDLYISAGKGDKVVKIGRSGAHGWVYKTEKDEKTGDIHIITGDKGHVVETWTAKEAPVHQAGTLEKSGEASTWVIKRQGDEEIEKSLARIRENLAKLEQEGAAVDEIRKSLEELEKTLKPRKGGLVTSFSRREGDKSAKYNYIGGVGGKLKDLYISAGDAEKSFSFIKVGEDAEGLIAYSISSGGQTRETYDRTVDRVKKELPEGAELEPEFDEEKGVFTLKIKGVQSEEITKAFIKKLAEIIEEETNKK